MEIDKFNQIEQKYGLYHDEIEGVNYWMYERFAVWHEEICQKKLNFQKAHMTHKKKWEYIPLVLKMICHCFKKKVISSKEVDVCFIAHERRVKINHVYQCIYTDKIAEEFSQNVVLEKPYQFSHLMPVSVKNLIYTDSIIIPSYVIYHVHKYWKTKLYRRLYEQVKEKLRLPLYEMERDYQIQLDREKIYRNTVMKIILVQKQFHKYKKLLEKINPKIIVEVCYYNMQCMIINEVSKKLHIPTIELQHGTMNEVHCAYHFAEKNQLIQIPDHLFLFSDFWRACIDFPLPKEKQIAVGFPFFEAKLREYEKKAIEKRHTITILFISQGTIGKPLSLLAVELRKKLDRQKYHIIYKLHPGEYDIWKTDYPWLFHSSMEIIDNLEQNLYDQFQVSDILVGVDSTGIYEGIGFGLTTYLYDIGHGNVMNKLIDLHCAYRIKDAEELAEKIIHNTVSKQNDKLLWKENAFHNMKCEIHKILSNSEL